MPRTADPPKPGAVIEIGYPFVREPFTDPDTKEEMITWRPGVRPAPPGADWGEADAVGTIPDRGRRAQAGSVSAARVLHAALARSGWARVRAEVRQAAHPVGSALHDSVPRLSARLHASTGGVRGVASAFGWL